MVPRKMVAVLVVMLPVLIATFAVLMMGYLLAEGIGDATGAAVMRGIGCGILALLAIDLVLLAGALGVNSLERPRPDDDRDSANP